MKSLTEHSKECLEIMFENFKEYTLTLEDNPGAEVIHIWGVTGKWIPTERLHAVAIAEMNLEEIMKFKKELIEEDIYSEDGSKLLTEDVEEYGYESVKVHQDAIHEMFKKVDSLKSYSEFST